MPVCRTVGGEPYGQPGSCKAGRGPDPVSYVVKIEAPAVDVHRSASEGSARQGQVMRGQTYEVLEERNRLG